MLKRHLIELSEIPAQGKTYSFDRQTKEMAERLTDVIGDASFEFKFTIQPIGQAFELIGEINTSMPLLCARCGIDIVKPIKAKAHEIILVQEEWPRGAQSTKTKHTNWSGDDLNCYFVKTSLLDAAELLHELIAAQEPVQPVRDEACYSSCENFQEVLKKGLIQTEDGSANIVNSPFAQLANLIKEKVN